MLKLVNNCIYKKKCNNNRNNQIIQFPNFIILNQIICYTIYMLYQIIHRLSSRFKLTLKVYAIILLTCKTVKYDLIL